MDQLGNHTFSHARFSGNQHGRVCIRDLGNQLADILHTFALTDKLLFPQIPQSQLVNLLIILLHHRV